MRVYVALLTLAVVVGFNAVAAGKSDYPDFTLSVGSGESLDGRLLAAKDDREIRLKSGQDYGYQTAKFEITIPKPGKMPEYCDAARIAISVNGSDMHPMDAWIKFPKSYVWKRLETEYLPTDKGSFVIFDLPDPKRSLASEEVCLRVEIKNPKRPADQFSVALDAVVLQVYAPVDEAPDLHKLAMEDRGGKEPLIRIHRFAGKSSGNYEKHIQRMWQSWRRGFGESARTILARKRDAQRAPIYTPDYSRYYTPDGRYETPDDRGDTPDSRD